MENAKKTIESKEPSKDNNGLFEERITDFSGMKILGTDTPEEKEKMMRELQKKRDLIYQQIVENESNGGSKDLK